MRRKSLRWDWGHWGALGGQKDWDGLGALGRECGG